MECFTILQGINDKGSLATCAKHALDLARCDMRPLVCYRRFLTTCARWNVSASQRRPESTPRDLTRWDRRPFFIIFKCESYQNDTYRICIEPKRGCVILSYMHGTQQPLKNVILRKPCLINKEGSLPREAK